VQASFQAICNEPAPLARKRGTAAERIAYHMLLALEHRAAGTGLEFINKPLKRTIQASTAPLLAHYHGHRSILVWEAMGGPRLQGMEPLTQLLV